MLVLAIASTPANHILGQSIVCDAMRCTLDLCESRRVRTRAAHVRSLGMGPNRWTLEQIREYFAIVCMYRIASEGSERKEKTDVDPF
jgi:hypothetical protein